MNNRVRPAWTLTLLLSASGLHAASNIGVNLRWTAPGDDAAVGTADHYELRYASVPITEANFSRSILAQNPPAPRTAGSTQEFAVLGLNAGAFYYFAVKSWDDAGNVSALSNVSTATAKDLSAIVGIDPPTDFAGNAYVRAYPNPMRGPCHIGFSTSGGRTAIFIYDAAGRLVWKEDLGESAAGEYAVPWDSTNVPSGVYYVLVRSETSEVRTKINVIH